MLYWRRQIPQMHCRQVHPFIYNFQLELMGKITEFSRSTKIMVNTPIDEHYCDVSFSTFTIWNVNDELANIPKHNLTHPKRPIELVCMCRIKG